MGQGDQHGSRGMRHRRVAVRYSRGAFTLGSLLLACGVAVLVACETNGLTDPAPPSTTSASGGGSGTGGDAVSSGGGAGGEAAGSGGMGGGLPPPWQGYRCTGDDCPPCAKNLPPCANVAEIIEGTCCAFGDPLPLVGQGVASEGVEVETDGQHTIVCGGFGADVSDVGSITQPMHLGKAGQRCQHAAFGPVLGGKKHFFIANHGDSYASTPFIQTFAIDGAVLDSVATLSEPGVLYEGIATDGSYLYAAVHAGGLRSYAIEADGTLTHLASLSGFDNAWKVALDQDYAYVADFAGGLRVVSIADPSAPALVDTLPTTGPPRDVAVGEGRVFVAMGGFGVEVLDRVAPGSLVPAAVLEVEGTAQAVDTDQGVLGVAAWTHVATYDASSLRLLATEKTRTHPHFEQDLGVAMDGPNLHVAEWEGLYILRHRPGFIAPDLWIEEKLFQFALTEPTVRAVVVDNRGELPLSLGSVTFSDPAYSTTATTVTIPPGQGDFFEISYAPTAAASLSTITIATDDPDPGDGLHVVTLDASDNATALNVGDTLTSDFFFLDPNNDLSNLEGKVTVLAYFALF